jgi:hypothetical protein
MMEAASTSETSVNFYQTTRRYNPEEPSSCSPPRELQIVQPIIVRVVRSKLYDELYISERLNKKWMQLLVWKSAAWMKEELEG